MNVIIEIMVTAFIYITLGATAIVLAYGLIKLIDKSEKKATAETTDTTSDTTEDCPRCEDRFKVGFGVGYERARRDIVDYITDDDYFYQYEPELMDRLLYDLGECPEDWDYESDEIFDESKISAEA